MRKIQKSTFLVCLFIAETAEIAETVETARGSKSPKVQIFSFQVKGDAGTENSILFQVYKHTQKGG